MVIQVSPTSIIGQDAAVDYAASRRNLGLGLFGAPPLRSRPSADVERSHPICICFEPAPNAPEVVEVSAVGLVREPASGAGLRGVSCAHGFDDHPILRALVLKRQPQETIGDSVDAPARPFPPLAPPLPQVLEALDRYPRIEPLRQLDQFTRELPASSSRVVPLPSAELLEFLTCLASAVDISMGLEFRPPSLELRLHPRQVLPEVELLQNLALGATDGNSNAASIDVHPKHIRAFSLRWFILSQDGEEPEIGLHNYGADFPAIPEVGLESSPSPILSDGQTYPLRVGAYAQGRVAPPRSFDAEKAPVEPCDHMVELVGGFTNAPSVAPGLTHELSSNAKPLTVFAVNQTVQFDAALDPSSFKQPEALPNHLEERIIGFPELCPLALGQRERVEHEAFLHGYQVRFDWYSSSDFWGERSPKVIFKLYEEPQNATILSSQTDFSMLFTPIVGWPLKIMFNLNFPSRSRGSLGDFR